MANTAILLSKPAIITESGFLGGTDEKSITRELRAAFTGIMLYIIHTPPIVKGEPIFEVGRIKQE